MNEKIEYYKETLLLMEEANERAKARSMPAPYNEQKFAKFKNLLDQELIKHKFRSQINASNVQISNIAKSIKSDLLQHCGLSDEDAEKVLAAVVLDKIRCIKIRRF